MRLDKYISWYDIERDFPPYGLRMFDEPKPMEVELAIRWLVKRVMELEERIYGGNPPS